MSKRPLFREDGPRGTVVPIRPLKKNGKKEKLPRIKTEAITLEHTFKSGPPYETTTAAELHATLAREGVAYVPRVLDAVECAAMEDGMWSFFERLTSGWDLPLRRDQPESWLGYFKLLPSHGMLHQHYRIGHAAFVWALRSNPKLVAIFAQLWGVAAEELLVSFDGVSFGLPPESVNGRGKYVQGGPGWFHTDQRLNDSSFRCIQSWVTARDVRPGDATLTVLRGSHLHHAEFARRFGYDVSGKADWHKLATQEELDFFIREKGCERVAICCPAGSLVCWSSCTIHSGQEALIIRPEPNIRCIVYLCYLPRARATAKQLEKKRAAFETMRMTSHWPDKAKLFGKQPRTYGAEMPAITEVVTEPPQLTELGRRLAGY